MWIDARENTRKNIANQRNDVERTRQIFVSSQEPGAMHAVSNRGSLSIHLLSGDSLVLSRYYDVLPGGVVC